MPPLLPPTPVPPPLILGNNYSVLISMILSFLEFYISEIIHYMTFWNYISFIQCNALKIQIIVSINIVYYLFLLLSNIRWYGCTTVYSTVEGHFGCFQFLAIKIKLLWIFMDTFLCGSVFISLGMNAWSMFYELHGKCIFSLIRKLPNYFPELLYYVTCTWPCI